MNFIIVKPGITRNEFLDYLIEYFPSIETEVRDPDYDGLIHLQVASLARYTNKCVEKKQFDELKRIFDFFDLTIAKVDSQTENALYVSFLEHVEFKNLSDIEIKRILKPEYFEIWTKLTKK